MPELLTEPKVYEPTAAGVAEAARDMGMPEAIQDDVRTEAGRAKLHAELDQAISERSVERSHKATGRRGKLLMQAASVVLAAGAALTPQGQEVMGSTTDAVHELITNQDDTVQPVEAGSPEAGIYNAKPGDTPNGIALQVEANIDGIAGNEEHRELQADISRQAGKDGLMPGEDIVVPAAADTNPEQPGVQL